MIISEQPASTTPQVPPESAGIVATPKTGNEPFTSGDGGLGFCVQDFWKWSASDLVSNATRGILAEFIVAKALGVRTDTAVRDEWGAFDLTSPTGRKIEVKSSAFLQSWPQAKLSSVQFPIRKKKTLDPSTGLWSAESQHQADVYVFALLTPKDKRVLNPLDAAQWEFYILSTRTVEGYRRSQHSITLKSLQGLASPVAYSRLLSAVETC